MPYLLLVADMAFFFTIPIRSPHEQNKYPFKSIAVWYIKSGENRFMKPDHIKRAVFLISIAVLALSACGSPGQTATPTEVNLEAIYTAAAATIFAGQTGTSIAQPSPTLSTTATPTGIDTATGSPTPSATRAVFYQPVLPASTVTPTITGTAPTPLPSATATYGAVGCNNSAFIMDVTIPNNTKMTVGQTFTKTWRIKNTGTCAWNGNYRFTFIGGNVMGSDTVKIRRVVGIGESTDFSLAMVAPSSPGTFSGYWRMADDNRSLFGAGFNVVIFIPGATFTPMPNVTITPTLTSPAAATQTSTPTSAPSMTPTPSNTAMPSETTTAIPSTP
jgi:hypothetical protein